MANPGDISDGGEGEGEKMCYRNCSSETNDSSSQQLPAKAHTSHCQHKAECAGHKLSATETTPEEAVGLMLNSRCETQRYALHRSKKAICFLGTAVLLLQNPGMALSCLSCMSLLLLKVTSD